LTHKREERRRKERGRPNYRQRGYDREYEDNRAIVLAEESACYICGGHVDKSLPGTDRNGPTTDHVIRRADAARMRGRIFGSPTCAATPRGTVGAREVDRFPMFASSQVAGEVPRFDDLSACL
jgi:hypothetical protein